MEGGQGKETVLDADDGTFASSHWLRLERWESGRTQGKKKVTIPSISTVREGMGRME